MQEEVRNWIKGDESGAEMLERVLRERPFLILPPPLDRFPLRLGNIVEIVGPSSSAKTQILIQAAISCILPKEWKGVHYGGLERLVLYFDLDSRFDIQRLSQSLNHHILQTNGSVYDEELFLACMRRFLYVRCYNSIEFLATLKTLRYQLQKESKAHGFGAHFLMIDSISAFYWIDRASTPVQVGCDKRKNFSLHTVVDTVVHEIQKLLQVQPMLIFATKTTILSEGFPTSDMKRNFRNVSSRDATYSVGSRGTQKHSYREFMPSTWQHFITHRILVQVLDEEVINKYKKQSTYTSEWLLPSLRLIDKFGVRDACMYTVT
ncbi:hypothetical protein AQUCO_02300063v1 [Aquilegia coerulea]|uniref:RecA family profile 1 domain-containing protein n=1 Tax=Aquilegia coerulea TaxID=218851 RepID=A0A2G5DC10_AQUCA|nr:hypothetical protein AQUCO_02300063v1 [Aquilegia coerulea]